MFDYRSLDKRVRSIRTDLLFLCRREVGTHAFEYFRSHTDRLAKRWVRVNGFPYVHRLATHFDRKADFADEVPRMSADDAASYYPMRVRIEKQLRETFIPAISYGAS